MAQVPLNPSCPSGGQYFACTSDSLFVGCCTSNDACSQKGCAAGNLKPASFNPAAFDMYPDQSCPSGSQWWTCQNSNPPFMGCCKNPPCNGGCAQADLAAGILNNANHAGYVTGSASSVRSSSTSSPPSSSSSSSASVGASSTTSENASSTASNPSSASDADGAASSTGTVLPAPSKPVLSTGAIAGISVGAFAAAILIMGLVMWFCRRHSRKSNERHALTRPATQPFIAEPMEYMYGKSPGASSLSKPSPASAQQYQYSPIAHTGTLPPQHAGQVSELETPPMVSTTPNMSLANRASGDGGLGLSYGQTMRSSYNTLSSFQGGQGSVSPMIPPHSSMISMELPGSPVVRKPSAEK